MQDGAGQERVGHEDDRGSEGLLVAREAGVLLLTLDRPARLNALTVPLLRALRRELEAAGAAPEVRAVLLSGMGRGFCAGQDLEAVGPDTDLGGLLREEFNPLILALRQVPKPVVCAVNGVAAGAGANLALACDIVLAAEGARFIQSFVRIGLVPDAGGSWVLPRLMGDARARAAAMLGEPVSGVQAASWGMVARAVPDAALAAEAMAVAQTLAAVPTEAIGLMKAAFLASATNGLTAQLALEAELQARAGATADFREGVAAFLEKRAPVFGGKP